jgi:predicted metalloprotease with PDZ domain
MRLLLPAAALLTLAAAPLPTPLPPSLPTPQDTPYPGEIALLVDATDLDHHVFAVTETLPVTPGPLTLLYPEWIPGTHGPTGPLAAFAGLTITANTQPIPWLRDTVSMAAFHVTVPIGVTTLQLQFQYLSPPDPKEGDVTMTATMLDLQWNQEVLYPAGHFARDITLRPSVKLPTAWQFGTALTPTTRHADTTNFDPVPLDVLLDSPLYAGRYFARFDLAPGAKTQVHLNVTADRPENLAITPEQLQFHRNLVTQAARNFASQHYDHFDFLLSLSDEQTFRGLEHHRSSENGQDPTYFTDPDKSLYFRDLLPHEYTHSWDGKFRRPADLWSPDYTAIPERDTLLWVYEGQTEYWGQVLAARAGLLTPAQFRDYIAFDAASELVSVGRQWRPLQDTTNDGIINQRRPLAWRSWSRAEDYYVEGLLIWLDADTLMREKTNNQKSLTTFAQNFFGIEDGNYSEITYTFRDVVTALNATMPYDWQNFLDTRLNHVTQQPPLDGLTRAGWKLTFTDEPSSLIKSREAAGKSADLNYSIGLGITAKGDIGAVRWDSPAYRAGLSRGTEIIAVNGLAFDSPATLKDAIKLAHGTTAPITLIIKDGRHFRTVSIDYHDGLRYPHLERIPNTPDRLADIIAPLK